MYVEAIKFSTMPLTGTSKVTILAVILVRESFAAYCIS